MGDVDGSGTMVVEEVVVLVESCVGLFHDNRGSAQLGIAPFSKHFDFALHTKNLNQLCGLALQLPTLQRSLARVCSRPAWPLSGTRR